MEDAKGNGVTIAISNDPPFMKMNPDGTPGGWGPEMDAAILKEMGITKFSGEMIEGGAMIPALQSNRATLSSSGALFIRPERCDAILFSEPVSCNSEGFLMSSSLAGKVATYKDVADQGLKIGVCAGCSNQKLAIEAGVKEENMVVYPDATTAAKLLEDKRVDIVGNDSFTLSVLFKRADPAEIHFVRIANTRGCAAAGFGKANAELRDAYNEGLRKVRANGKYMEIMKKYDFEEGAHDVETASMEQLCRK
ncbi:transporter substrate-binding domain-containing protein [Mesorhizobium sp. M0159]|uniref:transporter substrate-binding domain-containing protein n=1 Tax=Mesorhizobium sp. M0159 TaxID=2956900 RepID=UPI00333535AD